MNSYMDTSSRYRYLNVEHRPSGVAIVTLNRPEILNAINWDMHSELEQVFVDLDHDKSVKAIRRVSLQRRLVGLPSPTHVAQVCGSWTIKNLFDAKLRPGLA